LIDEGIAKNDGRALLRPALQAGGDSLLEVATCSQSAPARGGCEPVTGATFKLAKGELMGVRRRVGIGPELTMRGRSKACLTAISTRRW